MSDRIVIDMAIENFFGQRLRKLRKDAGLTQSALAEKLGIGQSTLAEYESGRVIPTATVVAITAKFFGVSADYLLGLTDNPSPNKGELPEIVKKKLEKAEKLEKAVNELKDMLREFLKRLNEQ